MIDRKQQMKHPMTKEWHDVIAKYALLSKYGNALEVGTAGGLSSNTILRSGTGVLTSIDIDLTDACHELNNHDGYVDRVTYIETDSKEFWKINTDTFDFICIDGSHDYEQVLDDCREAWKVLNPKGWVIFDDYNHVKLRKDVGRAVDEWADEEFVILIKESNKAIAFKPDVPQERKPLNVCTSCEG